MRALDTCYRKDIRIIVWGDSAYPRRLAQIYDPPAVLFSLGRMPIIDEECAVAIAGAGELGGALLAAERLGLGKLRRRLSSGVR